MAPSDKTADASADDTLIADAIREGLGIKTSVDARLLVEFLQDRQRKGVIRSLCHGFRDSFDGYAAQHRARVELISQATTNSVIFGAWDALGIGYDPAQHPPGLIDTMLTSRVPNNGIEDMGEITSHAAGPACKRLQMRNITWEGTIGITLGQLREQCVTGGRTIHYQASALLFAAAVMDNGILPHGRHFLLANDGRVAVLTLSAERPSLSFYEPDTLLQEFRNRGTDPFYVITTPPTV